MQKRQGRGEFAILAIELLVLFHVLHKGFLMYQPCILSVVVNAEVTQSKLDEALVNKVYR
jgi:hypothetical protein